MRSSNLDGSLRSLRAHAHNPPALAHEWSLPRTPIRGQRVAEQRHDPPGLHLGVPQRAHGLQHLLSHTNRPRRAWRGVRLVAVDHARRVGVERDAQVVEPVERAGRLLDGEADEGGVGGAAADPLDVGGVGVRRVLDALGALAP